MDPQTIKRLYNFCRPDEPLKPDDERNVDFDRVDHGVRLRGEAWAKRLAKMVVLPDSDAAPCVLLTGLPGSGKSTELKRLAKHLHEGSSHGRYFPVLIDAEAFVDLTAPIDFPDLLLGIVYHTERCILEAEGKNPDQAGEESRFARLWHVLTTTEVTLKAPKIPVAELTGLPVPGGPIPFEMKARPSFREQVRKRAAAHITAFREQVCEAIETLVDRVRELEGGVYDNMVIIVDSLERLRGATSTWKVVLESAEQLFQGGAPYLRLPAPVLYTVPPALRARNVDIEFMPMVKIHERDSADSFEPGIEAMRELVRRRIPDAELKGLLGETAEARIEQAIQWSAGYPRDLLRILQDVLRSDSFPVSDEEWRHIRGRLFDAYRRLVPGDVYDWLARVADEHDVAPGDDQDERLAADRMLSLNVVLFYQNETNWYDLHPAVKEIPGVLQAMERRRAPAENQDD